MNELLSGRFRLLNLPPRKRRTADSLGLQSRQFRNAIPSPPQRVLFAAGARFLLGKMALALTARYRRHCPLRRHRTGFFGQRFRYQWRGIFTTSASATAALGSGNGAANDMIEFNTNNPTGYSDHLGYAVPGAVIAMGILLVAGQFTKVIGIIFTVLV